MTTEQQQLIKGFIRRYSQETPGNLPVIYQKVKLQIGVSFFGNSLSKIESNRKLYDELVNYASREIGLK